MVELGGCELRGCVDGAYGSLNRKFLFVFRLQRKVNLKFHVESNGIVIFRLQDCTVSSNGEH